MITTRSILAFVSRQFREAVIERAEAKTRAELGDKERQAMAVALAAERGRREILERSAATNQTLISFLCGRVNQLEKERAMMLKKLINIEIPIPEMMPAPAAGPSMAQINRAALDIFGGSNGGGLFEDMGDDAAKKAGIGWDSQGNVRYDVKEGEKERD